MGVPASRLRLRCTACRLFFTQCFGNHIAAAISEETYAAFFAAALHVIIVAGRLPCSGRGPARRLQAMAVLFALAAQVRATNETLAPRSGGGVRALVVIHQHREQHLVPGRSVGSPWCCHSSSRSSTGLPAGRPPAAGRTTSGCSGRPSES